MQKIMKSYVRPDRFDRALNSKSFHPTSAKLAMFMKMLK